MRVGRWIMVGVALAATLVGASAAQAAISPVPWAGHYARLDGQRVFMLAKPFPVRARASNLGNQFLNDHGPGNMCMSSFGRPAGGYAAINQCIFSANQAWDVFVSTNGWGLENLGDGLCLNNYQGRRQNYNPQNMERCDPSDLKQNYGLQYNSGGFIMQTNSGVQVGGGVGPSGYCISDLGYTLNNSTVVEYVCNFNNNQTWGKDG
jgi:hypothetical protein